MRFRGSPIVSNLPNITRVRHDVKRRHLAVARVERLAPKMLRIVLRGDELENFTSLGFDDHVKVFFESAQSASSPEMRDFTPRRFNPRDRELWIDFYLHEAGPAASWAAQAATGQTLTVGGPRGSFIISPEGIDSHVLVGDETALPAIGRRLEELPASTRALVIVESDADSEGYPLEGAAALEVVRVARRARSDSPGEALIGALRKLEFPPGRCFTWVATESHAARATRRYLVEERGLDKHWIKAAGYWQHGATGTHEVIQDAAD
jgi:NADPH-dependent ferric siderophore reductase